MGNVCTCGDITADGCKRGVLDIENAGKELWEMGSQSAITITVPTLVAFSIS